MSYTIKQCKADMLLIWGILKDNPSIDDKETAISMLPEGEQERFMNMSCCCPACEYSDHKSKENPDYINGLSSCRWCPVWRNVDKETCMEYDHDIDRPGLFEIWEGAFDDETRQKAAQAIYDLALQINDEEEIVRQ